MKKTVLVSLLLLVACTNVQTTVVPTESPMVLPTLLTQTPTENPSLTPTDLPVPTATLILPVTEGTPFPYQLPMISSDNATELHEIFRMQNESIIWNTFTSGEYTILETNHGVQIRDQEDAFVTQLPSSEIFCPNSVNFGFSSSKVFVSTNQEVAIATNNEIQIYSLGGDLLHTLPLNKNTEFNYDQCGVEGIYRFSPNLEWVAIGYPKNRTNINGTVSVYDINTGESVLDIGNAYIPRFFTPNSKFLVVEDINSRFLVYQTSDWSRVTALPAASQFLGARLSISPDGQYLVAYPYVGNLTFYNLLHNNKFVLPSIECGNYTDCNTNVLFSKDGKELGVYRLYTGEGFFSFDLSTGKQIDHQDTYDSALWDEALPETNYIQSRYQTSFVNNDFTFGGKSDSFIAVQDTQTQEITIKFCETVTSPQEKCHILPNLSEWDDIEVGKTISVPITNELAGRCMFFSDNRINCFPVYASNNDRKVNSIISGGQLCINNGNLCTSLDDGLNSIYNSQYQTMLVSFSETNSIYCALGPEDQRTCWKAANRFDGINNIYATLETATFRDICQIGFNGKQTCNTHHPDEVLFVSKEGEQYKIIESGASAFDLVRIKDGTTLTTLSVVPENKVLWFQVLAEEKYLAYVIQREVFDINLRIVTMQGSQLQNSKLSTVDYSTSSLNDRFFAFSGNVNGFTRGFVWDIDNLENPFKWSPSGINNDAISFTPDNQYFVYVERKKNKDEPWKENGVVRFFDLEKQKIAKDINIEFFHNGVNTMAFSSDGRLLAMGLNDGTVWLFDVEAGTLINTWQAHIGQVQNLEFSPDGTKLLSSGALDETVSVWGVYP